MAKGGNGSGRGPGRRRAAVAWSEALGKRICRRVAGGELLYALCRERGMPSPQSVRIWTQRRPAFAQALAEARRASGRPAKGGGGVFSYCREAANEVFERLCEGESLTKIGADPTMPSLSTLFYWRKKIAEFEELVALGKRIQAERFCDLGWEMACEAQPETAYLTHVRLTQLRWMAGVMAPRTYRLKPVEPEKPRETMTILFRHFKVEEDPETGQRKVVAYCPNPETGIAEREDDPDWEPPAGCVRLPSGPGQA